MMPALNWGLPLEQVKKHIYPHAVGAVGDYLSLGNITLKNFPGDCGSLVMIYANRATEEDLARAVKYASLSGFTKIFATVVGATEPKQWSVPINDAVAAFKKARFKLVHHGKSNRNPDKDDYVFVKIIRNPKHRGY